jgi:glycosyltransferase involved in cell wall biosynthesis
MPEISVLMSVFNSEKWLKSSIDSVLSQSEDEFEFIIINDGSTDNTSSILKSYKDDRIIIVDQENRGLTKSLNVGLNLAKGKYIARIDADDISMQNRLDVQKKFMEENPDIALVGSDAIIIDEKGNKVGHAKYPTSHTMLSNKLYNFKSVFPHSSIFFRKNIIMKGGGYNENFIRSQDYDLYLRISEEYKIACINKPLLNLRLNLSGPTYSDDNQLIFGLAAVINHYLRDRGLEEKIGAHNNWNNYYNEVSKWVIEKNLDKKHQSKIDFRICRLYLRQKKYLDAFKKFLVCVKNDPMFIFYKGVPINFPIDIKHFLAE